MCASKLIFNACVCDDQAGSEEREAMQAANQAAVNTVQQMAGMHQRLEMQQLEKIRDICEAALEDMESLPDKVRLVFVKMPLSPVVLP